MPPNLVYQGAGSGRKLQVHKALLKTKKALKFLDYDMVTHMMPKRKGWQALCGIIDAANDKWLPDQNVVLIKFVWKMDCCMNVSIVCIRFFCCGLLSRYGVYHLNFGQAATEVVARTTTVPTQQTLYHSLM